MVRFIVLRLALGILTLFVVSVLIFTATELLPGDVATAILGNQATPEALEAIRRSLHLHDPAVIRYLHWFSDFVRGNLGTSLTNGRPVVDELGFRLQNTLLLAGIAALISVPLAVSLGILTAIYQGTIFDRTANIITLSFISFPTFFIGYVLIGVFAVRLGWLPSLSTVSGTMPLGERLYAMTLPVITLIFSVLAHMMRLTRASILGVMSNPYVEMAFLNGESRTRVVLMHALPNVLGPIISVVALNLAYLVVGVVVVEVVFVYPGVGTLMVDAVSSHDVPAVQACGLIFATIYISLNLIADIAGVLMNPRLRSDI